MSDDSFGTGAPAGTIQGLNGRGYFVAPNFSASDVVAVAQTFEQHWGVSSSVAEEMATVALFSLARERGAFLETAEAARKGEPLRESWPQGSGLCNRKPSDRRKHAA